MREVPLTIVDAAAALRARHLTSVELTEACFERADELDPQLGTYVTRFDETALAAAARADADLAAGVDRGPLHGIPVGIKDIVAAIEGPTTGQSLVLEPEWGDGKDAPVVSRLRDAGAVVMGKTTTMEFAMGFPDPTKPFPLPRNPWNLDAWPGGSSSGTASGIAAGLFLAGIGTDTGGSIRYPAAFCGISGLLPTFGRVPRSGALEASSTLDRVGPLARSARDCALMVQAMAGRHASDPSSIDRPVPEYDATLTADGGLDGLRVGVVHEHHFGEGSDPAALERFDAAAAQLAELGATVVEVGIPMYHEVVASALLTSMPEALARHRAALLERPQDYFAESRSSLYPGLLVEAADYVQATRVLRVGQRALAGLFADVDVVLTPTATIGAFTYQAVEERGGLLGFLGHLHNVYWNGVGNPVLSVPIGFTADGMPLGMQIAGRPFDEATILRVGHVFQLATDWHLRTPTAVGAAG